MSVIHVSQDERSLTGLEMTRMLASGAESATALARSRTIEALVLKRSRSISIIMLHDHET